MKSAVVKLVNFSSGIVTLPSLQPVEAISCVDFVHQLICFWMCVPEQYPRALCQAFMRDGMSANHLAVSRHARQAGRISVGKPDKYVTHATL